MKRAGTSAAASLYSDARLSAPGAHPSHLTFRHPHLSCHRADAERQPGRCPLDDIYSGGTRRYSWHLMLMTACRGTLFKKCRVKQTALSVFKKMFLKVQYDAKFPLFLTITLVSSLSVNSPELRKVNTLLLFFASHFEECALKHAVLKLSPFMMSQRAWFLLIRLPG